MSTLSALFYYKQQSGMSYVEISRLSGVPLGTVRKIFEGTTRSPRKKTIDAIAQVLKEAVGYDTYRPIQQHSSPDTGDRKADMISDNACSYGAAPRIERVIENGRYTLDDYYALPEDRRVELIDGEFFDMSAPTTAHQYALSKLHYQIEKYIEAHNGTCISFESPIDVQLDCDNKTMVEPDIVILCDMDKLIRRCIYGAPDFIIEVLSTSTMKKDLTLKLSKYRNAGVREYWAVNIKGRRVLRYFFEEDEFPTIFGFDSDVPVGIYAGELKLSFKKISEFMDLPLK